VKEAGDPRALLRKAEAHLNLGELVEAKKAVAQGLAKGGGPFVALNERIGAAEKAEKQREADLYKRMLGK
jgi:hypothetical protein